MLPFYAMIDESKKEEKPFSPLVKVYRGRLGHSINGFEFEENAMDGLLRSLIKTVRRRLRADEEVTVEAVTKELGYTRQYISGRFHRVTGRLLSHFLKEKRLEKAARLLKSGNMRISQIARRCGFDSENYFRQQFRERFGMSPRQFRTSGKLR